MSQNKLNVDVAARIDIQYDARPMLPVDEEFGGSSQSGSLETCLIRIKPAIQRLDQTSHHLPVYSMGTRPKGYLLMISNVEFTDSQIPMSTRKGADIDERAMAHLFSELGFIVSRHRNLSRKEMKRVISDFATLPEHKECSACVVAIMSHGSHEETAQNATNLISADGKPLATDWVLCRFTQQYATTTINKPKIFIFQCCRGSNIDSGVTPRQYMKPMPTIHQGIKSVVKEEFDKHKCRRSLEGYRDMLIAFSTIPGYVSHRDTVKGTWFIQLLCDVFMEHAWQLDIEDMLRIVDSRLSKYESTMNSLQTSTYESRGFKKFYFNPGLYDK